MAHLGITATVDRVRLAEHRLTHASRAPQPGGPRTLAQLKSDLALDLLTGRGAEAPTPAYARPVINLTVPLQTVMGIADDPGILSGGDTGPRRGWRARSPPIPTPPGTGCSPTRPARWWSCQRRRTDRPHPIWRHVTAQWVACFEPSCHAPATQAELDHRIRWPEGETRTGNLWPGCKRGHTAKHTPGFSIEQAPDGSLA